MTDARTLELFLIYIGRGVSPWKDGDNGAIFGERFVDLGWANMDGDWLLVPTEEGWRKIAEETFRDARIRPNWIPDQIVNNLVAAGQLIRMKQPRPKPSLYRWVAVDR